VSAAPRTEQEVQSTIERLQRAEEDVRRLQDELIDAAAADRKTTIAALKEAVTEGLGEGEGVEAAIALVPLAEVLGELDGPDVCDLLIAMLGAEEPEVRFIAGRGLQDLAFDRFKEVAEATERAVTRLPANSQALRELPYVIAEVAEPGAPRILRGYLQHAEPEIVASAIEALASIGDPAAVPELRKLTRDPRTVQIDDEHGEAQASIGALAQEAISMIEGGGELEPPPPPPRGGPPRHSRGAGGRGR
jgi:HEAT repeat protein